METRPLPTENRAIKRRRMLNLCRLCCSEINLTVVSDKLMSKVKFDNVKFSYFHKIEECLQIRLQQPDLGYPVQICVRCLSQVDRFFDFKMMVIYNQIKLRRVHKLKRNRGA